MVFFVFLELLLSAPLSYAGSSNASVRVLAGSSNASVQVLAGSSNASVLSECHLRTVSIASCRRFSNLGFAQPLGSSAASRSSSRPGRRRRTSHGRGMRQILYMARSRLYRNEIVQLNMRLKALAETYTMHSFALL